MSNQNEFCKQDELRVRGVLSRMVERNREVPVFIHPTELKFSLTNKGPHSQPLTIYNPYDFPIKYQVLVSTNKSQRFSVGHCSDTIIAAHSFIELNVQHHDPVQKNVLSRNKILITLHDAATNQLIGKRCIYALLLPKINDSSDDDDDDDENTHFYAANRPSLRRQEVDVEGYNITCQLHLIVLFIFLCGMLALPTNYEEIYIKESRLPKWLHIKLSYKLLVAFILGIITMNIFKSN